MLGSSADMRISHLCYSRNAGRLVFDLGPDCVLGWDSFNEGAIVVRDALAQMRLDCFAMLYGGKGFHAPSWRRQAGMNWARSTAPTFLRSDASLQS